MTKLKLFAFLLFTINCVSQKVEIAGTVQDQTNGAFIIEIVVNDTLAKIITDPKLGRAKYIRLYQNPEFVVRTDKTGLFKIKANPSDTLFFKSYGHKTQKHLVRDLAEKKDLRIILERETD